MPRDGNEAVRAADPSFSDATFDRLQAAETRGTPAQAVRDAGC